MARYWLSCPFLIIVIFSRLLFIVTINEWFMQLVLQDFDPINCIALQFVCMIHAVWIVLLKISKKEPSSLCVKSLCTFFFFNDFFGHFFISDTLAKVKICKIIYHIYFVGLDEIVGITEHWLTLSWKRIYQNSYHTKRHLYIFYEKW